MLIPQRIQKITNLVHVGNNVADVGSDHGILEISLLRKDVSPYILAIENKKGPYQISKNNLKYYENVKVILSDGIRDIDPSIRTVVIAGMGGQNMITILNNNKEKLEFVEQIIVDAHRDTSLVRKAIIDLGFKIEKEEIVLENKVYYFIISFVKGMQEFSEDELEFGYKTYLDPLFNNYKTYKLSKINMAINELSKSNKEINKVKINELEKYKERLTNYGHNEVI